MGFHLLFLTTHIWDFSEASHLLGRNRCSPALSWLNVVVQPHEQSWKIRELLQRVHIYLALREFVLSCTSRLIPSISVLLQGMINLFKV